MQEPAAGGTLVYILTNEDILHIAYHSGYLISVPDPNQSQCRSLSVSLEAICAGVGLHGSGARAETMHTVTEPVHLPALVSFPGERLGTRLRPTTRLSIFHYLRKYGLQ